MDGNDGVLPQGTPYAAPKAYADTLLRAGNVAASGNVSATYLLSTLIEFFENEGISYKTQREINSDGLEVVSAVVFHDEILAPTTPSPCSVYTADVTFGLTAKWFFLIRLLASE
jgi:hypothetical protein